VTKKALLFVMATAGSVFSADAPEGPDLDQVLQDDLVRAESLVDVLDAFLHKDHGFRAILKRDNPQLWATLTEYFNRPTIDRTMLMRWIRFSYATSSMSMLFLMRTTPLLVHADAFGVESDHCSLLPLIDIVLIPLLVRLASPDGAPSFNKERIGEFLTDICHEIPAKLATTALDACGSFWRRFRR
jgi:hypothetical protein